MEEGLAGPSSEGSATAAGPSTKVPLTEEGVATSSSSEVGQTDTTEAAEAESRPKAPGIFSRKSSGAFNPSFAGLGIDSSVFQPAWPTVPGEFLAPPPYNRRSHWGGRSSNITYYFNT